MKVWLKNKVIQYVKPFCCNDMKRFWKDGRVTYPAIGNNVIIILKGNNMNGDPQIHFCPFCGEVIHIKEISNSIENKIEDEDKSQDLPWSWAY